MDRKYTDMFGSCNKDLLYSFIEDIRDETNKYYKEREKITTKIVKSKNKINKKILLLS